MVPVVVVSNLGLPQPLHQLISAVPRLPCTGMGWWNLLQIRCQALGFIKGLQDESCKMVLFDIDKKTTTKNRQVLIV